ncbi:unnamed protein product, partial [Prorocentrum cordatum]
MSQPNKQERKRLQRLTCPLVAAKRAAHEVKVPAARSASPGDEAATLGKGGQVVGLRRGRDTGNAVDQGEFVCRGGDYDTKLILVLSGTLEKLVGDSPYGGRCVVRHLRRGDCEGLTEFLGAGSEQRTCCLRGGPGGARVRFVTRERFQKLLREEAPGLEEGRAALKFPDEAAYFAKLVLDRIDSLSHKAAEELLEWPSGVEGQAPLRLMSLPGQTLFSVDSGLGTSVSGPLPEGIEERYFLDGQTVIRPGIRGDCCVMILRGEAHLP